jgi:hypothetical protein
VDGERTAAERYARDLELTVDRLRSMGLARLAASFEPESTRADAGRALAQRLADTAAALAGEPQRDLPRLGDQAVGDQVAVCGADLLAAGVDSPDALEIARQDLLDVRRRV